MATPVEKFLRLYYRPFPDTKLDVPRLAAPRGPARGRARANRPGRSYRMSVYHSGACVVPTALARTAAAPARARGERGAACARARPARAHAWLAAAAGAHAAGSDTWQYR